jgi:hypothetical protein
MGRSAQDRGEYRRLAGHQDRNRRPRLLTDRH